MDLHQLRIFVTVAAEHSVTRAAKRLFMTPPSVSAHIKALESELGVRIRISKGFFCAAPS
jgi:DNA-binding transcriptional LysR family regulator